MNLGRASNEAGTAAAGRWLVRLDARPQARLRLFCFPYAGGGASVFAGWPALLPKTVDAYAVQLPGREDRIAERGLRTCDAVVAALAEVLPPHLDRPYVFFGHSMGALLAYALAVELRARGEAPPVALFVSGRGAPHRHLQQSGISALPDAELMTHLHALDGTPKEVFENDELRRLVLPVLRGDFAVCESYRFRDTDPLRCDLSVFGGRSDAVVPPGALSSWAELTTGAFRLRMMPGGHFFLKSSRGALLHAISTDLTDILSGNAGRPCH